MKYVVRFLKFAVIAILVVAVSILIYRMRGYLALAVPAVLGFVAVATLLVGLYHHFFVFIDPEQDPIPPQPESSRGEQAA
jgi:hypothetical protein